MKPTEVMPLAGKRIFILEDNVGNRAIIQHLLENKGAKTSFERWGVDTIERIQRFLPVDLLIFDLMLPGGISGYDIFDKVCILSDLKNIPAIVVSACDPDTEIPKAKHKGFKAFISKPIDSDEFPYQIQKILNGHSIWDE